MEKKENLIIVHSFPTNSDILSGLYKYLENFFNLYPIDLPGFNPDVKPLNNPSLSGYSSFVEEKIRQFSLDSYLLGGISFGFRVVNNSKLDRRCCGILAIEPLVSIKDLHQTQVYALKVLLKTFKKTGLGKLLWTSSFIGNLFSFILKVPVGTIKMIQEQIDYETFMSTAEIILHARKTLPFHPIPYALIINPTDNAIAYEKTLDDFKKGSKQLFILNTRIEHSLKRTDTNYFEESINPQDVEEMLRWFRLKRTGRDA